MDKDQENVLTPGVDEAPTYSRRRKTAVVAKEQERPETEEKNGDPELPAYYRGFATPIVLICDIRKLFIDKLNDTHASPLSGSYRHLLFHLAQMDGRTQLELARLTHLKPPTVSLSLAKLEAEGYIKRVADPADLRQTRVYITEKGKEVHEEAKKVLLELEEEFISDLTDEERETLTALLKKIREKL